jgi:hypothetical protein
MGMNNTTLIGIRTVAEELTKANAGRWQVEQYIGGRWAVVMFGLSHERAVDMAKCLKFSNVVPMK